MIQIDQNIPLPPRRYGPEYGALKRSYPFAKMAVGDSFLITGAASSVEAAASQWGRKNGRKFSARYCDGGVRIWRVA